MTRSDEAIRARLTAARDEALARIADHRANFTAIVESARDSNVDDEHDPEGTTTAFERSLTSALADGAESRLAEIEAAIARLDAGTYGVCVRCGAEIPAARLEARPFSATCVACA